MSGGNAILIEISRETEPLEIPRTSTPEVDCYYLASSGILEVQFNLNVGSIDLEVADQTNSIVGSGHLSTTPGALYIPLAVENGLFSISIDTSSGINYYGSFIL